VYCYTNTHTMPTHHDLPLQTPPVAELIAIGDELLIGRTQDTNSAFMARALGEIGLPVLRFQAIADDAAAIHAALDVALARLASCC
jgi:molybdopterin-biosynthesis enzyme MoeA-like protein